MKTAYTMIRGPKQAARCTNKSTYGRPLYCSCGCQTPCDEDPEINLSGITVGKRIELNPGSVYLLRDGQSVGSISPQHPDYICIDGYEYIGCNKDLLADLIAQARRTSHPVTITAGDTPAETAARETSAEADDLADQDARNAGYPGYCTKCHTYCYGDCEA